MKLRNMIAVALLLLLLAPAAIFAGGEKEAGGAAEKEEFRIYWAANHRYETYDKVFANFAEEKNYKLNAQFFSWNEFSTKIKSDFAADTAPDVIEVPAPWIAEFANLGELRDLTDELKAWDSYDQFFDSTWVETSLDGKHYGVKLHHTAFGMYYNRDQFEQAGLDPDDTPETIDEFIDTVRTITNELGPDVHGFSFDPSSQYLISFIANAQTPYIINDNNRIAIDTPEIRETLRKLHGLARSDAVLVPEAGGEEAHFSHRNLFINGKTSMMISGPWDIKNIKQGNPDLNYGVFMVPHLEGVDPRVLVAGTAGGVPQDAEHPEDAVELLNRITSLDTQVQATLETGMLYPRKDWANDSRVQDTAGVRFFGPILPKATPFDTPVKKLGLPEITWGGHLFNRLYETLIFSDEPIDPAIDRYVREANKLLEEET